MRVTGLEAAFFKLGFQGESAFGDIILAWLKTGKDFHPSAGFLSGHDRPWSESALYGNEYDAVILVV